MATFTVNTAADVVNAADGRLSLREAVAQANATVAADTIVFASPLEGQTLTLFGSELTVTQDVTIDGDVNNDGIEVTLVAHRYFEQGVGDVGHRVLAIVGGSSDLNLTDITLAGGFADDMQGGAIFLGGGSLTLTGATVRDSEATAGGGIFADGGSRLTIINSNIAGNYANDGGGGGMYAADGSRVLIANSNIADNQTYEDGAGGGIAVGSNVTLSVRSSQMANNDALAGGAIFVGGGSYLLVDGGSFVENGHTNGLEFSGSGGALSIFNSRATINNTAIVDNFGTFGAGIDLYNSRVSLLNSTVAGNRAANSYYSAGGGGIDVSGSSTLIVRNSTITDNRAEGPDDDRFGEPRGGFGGGISAAATAKLDFANSIVAGNKVTGLVAEGPDIFGTITRSNGRNVFGTDVDGNVDGDRENIPASAIFATIDPTTGGGQVNNVGLVLLRDAAANPALSAADPLAAMPAGQLGGARPQPAGTLADLGPVESRFSPSRTASLNNDVLTGTNAANTLDGQDGADLLLGLAGNDALFGRAGSDVLDGGTGNDRLDGGFGIDLALFAGSAAVTVDLAAAADTARRGREVDTLVGIEGAVGGSGADRFLGDAGRNFFQGGAGKDSFTGGAGSDLFDFDQAAHSPAGAGRDVVTDFVHLTDLIDLMGVDADVTVAGDQAFRWVGTAALGTTPGVVGFARAGSTTIVRASNDADAAAELEIQLNGRVNLTADDFYL